jgi:hypothetical protein
MRDEDSKYSDTYNTNLAFEYFHLILPQFKMVHVITLEGSILVCSCGYKHRYGIPCRHLFSLEPKYDINDIYCCWQGSYALFAFHPSCQSTTKDFLMKSKIEHIVLSLKTMKQHQQEHILPYLVTLMVHYIEVCRLLHVRIYRSCLPFRRLASLSAALPPFP